MERREINLLFGFQMWIDPLYCWSWNILSFRFTCVYCCA